MRVGHCLLPYLLLLAACTGLHDGAAGAATYPDGVANSAAVIDLRVGDSYQRLLTVRPRGEPKAVLILLTGGDGRLGIGREGQIRSPNNFLVRTREDWAAHGFLVLIPDLPSDRSSLFDYRLTESYRTILGAIVAHARQLSSAPIWLAGTSAGAPAAVFGAASLPASVHGIAISSSVMGAGRNTAETVFAAGPERVRVPVLIQYHRADSCNSTPPSMVPRLKAALSGAPIVEQQEFTGGLPPRSQPCEARAAHGFYGIENQVVDAAARWMLAH